MNQTDNTIPSSQTQAAGATVSPNNGARVSKEHELPQVVTPEAVQTLTHEIEVPAEVEKAGVTGIRETIELPPDVTKLGVTPTGAVPPSTSVTALPPITLPISDDKVITGLHVAVISSLRWLAVWCIKKLKKAHIMLKVIHGKIVRIKTK